MPIKKTDVVINLAESIKNFFVDLSRPNMTIEKISDIISPRLDELIRKYEEHDLNYGAGKFSIKYADKNHFQLEFEMYFQDREGKWHKCADTSDKRAATLLEENTWKTIKSLKSITFPIEEPQDTKEPQEEVPPVQTKKSFATDKEKPSFKELIAFLDSARTWQEFETCLKEFLNDLPQAMKKAGVYDYAAKIYSRVVGETLHFAYIMYYKEDGKWTEQKIARDFDELQAPTWATKGLSAVEEDVTARYEKNLQVKI